MATKTVEISTGIVELPGCLTQVADGNAVFTIYFRDGLLGFAPDYKAGIVATVHPQWSDVYVVFSCPSRARSTMSTEGRHFTYKDSDHPLRKALVYVYNEMEDFCCAFVYGRPTDSVAVLEPLSDNLPRPELIDMSKYALLAVIKVSDRALPV